MGETRGRQHETDELRYGGTVALVPLAPVDGWPQLPDGCVAYDVTYEIDVADRTPRKQPWAAGMGIRQAIQDEHDRDPQADDQYRAGLAFALEQFGDDDVTVSRADLEVVYDYARQFDVDGDPSMGRVREALDATRPAR